MSELLKIVQKHRATFYNYATNEPTRRWPNNSLKIFAAIVASFVFSSLAAGFLGAVLTVYSILIGFSFNVLVYLLSFAKEKIDVPSNSIESDLRAEKIHKLTEELFFNVSYFNLVSLALVVATLVCFLNYLPMPLLHAALPKLPVPDLIVRAEPWTAALFRVCYFLLIIESLAALVRTIERVSFFFSLKSKTPNK